MLASPGGRSAAGSCNGFGGWAVERKSDGQLIGMVALFTAWRDLEPEFGDDPEMGWIFATEAHGQGLAGEACRAVLDWADTASVADVRSGRSSRPPTNRRSGWPSGWASCRSTKRAYHDEPILVLRRAPRG